MSGPSARSLLLMRHGKSDWDADSGDDHDRPLANRGRKASRTMGRFVVGAGVVPDAVACSTARRARDTLALAMEEGRWSAPVRHVRELYEAAPGDVLEVVRATPADVATLLLVGHEPAWSELLALLTGARVRFPTAAVARVDLTTDGWAGIGEATGVLAWLVTPRLLAGFV